MNRRKIIIGLSFSSNTENNRNKQSIGQDLAIKKKKRKEKRSSCCSSSNQGMLAQVS